MVATAFLIILLALFIVAIIIYAVITICGGALVQIFDMISGDMEPTAGGVLALIVIVVIVVLIIVL